MTDGDILELAVETYLAADRGVFLNPDYLVGTANVWEARADFLALDFPNRQAWMVEVTKAPKLSDKINKFDGEYATRIMEQLEKNQRIRVGSAADEWQIGLW